MLDFKDEIWKEVIGYEGLYMVSNYGRIKSRYIKKFPYLSNEYKLLKPYKARYIRVVLTKNGVGIDYVLHRHVAVAFIPNPHNKPFINHKNGIKHDNRVENLEWCTQQENVIHAHLNNLTNPRSGEDSHYSILKETQVINIIKSYNNGQRAFMIARDYNISSAAIRDIINGKTWKNISDKYPIVKRNKINEQIVNPIRELYKNGYTYDEISKLYSVGRSSVIHLVNNRTWKHVI